MPSPEWSPPPWKGENARSRLLGWLLASILGTIWLAWLMASYGPATWNTWGFEFQIKPSADDVVQVYFATEDGLTEENSLRVPVEGDRWNRVFVPLPEFPIHALRLDPLSAPGEAVVRHPAVKAPFYLPMPEPVELRLKADHDLVEFDQEDDSPLWTMVADAPDPAVWISLKPRPLEYPADLISKACWVRLAVSGMLLTGLLLLLSLLPSFRKGFLWILGLGLLTWVIAHYVLPLERLAPELLYHILLVPMILVLLVAPRELEEPLLLVRQNMAWTGLLTFLAYFLIRFLTLPADPALPRWEVWTAIVALAASPLILAGMKQRFPFTQRAAWISWVMVVAVVAASFALLHLTSSSLSAAAPLEIANLNTIIPLRHAISGTACFAVALVLVLHSTSWKEQAAPLWLAAFTALPIALYVLLSQSRSVILGVLAALLLLMISPHVPLRSRILTGTIMAAMIFFVLGNVPARLAPEPTTTPAVAEAAFKGGLMNPATEERLEIWKVWFDSAREKPIFGHGFAGGETLLPAPRSVWISVTWAGGIIGLLLFLIMLATTTIPGIRRAWKEKQPEFLLGSALTGLAATVLIFEGAVLTSNSADAILWRPNDYWIFFWGAIIFTIVQTSQPGPKPAGKKGSLK